MESPDFKRVLRGYDSEAVDQAWAETDRQLSEVNAANKELRLQINSLREQNSEWGNRLKYYEQIEKDMRDALLSAQRVATQIKDEAIAQSEEILQSARTESEGLLMDATRILESKEIEVETMLIERQAEILQTEEQLNGLTERKAELKTQVDKAIRYLEMAKELFPSEQDIDKEL